MCRYLGSVLPLLPPHPGPDRDSSLSVSKAPLFPKNYSYAHTNYSLSTFDEDMFRGQA